MTQHSYACPIRGVIEPRWEASGRNEQLLGRRRITRHVARARASSKASAPQPSPAALELRRISTARGRSGRRGFTLIELVTSMSVGVIICGVAGSLLWNASRQRAEVSARGELVDMSSAAVEVMLRYIREIPQDECPGGPAPCLLGNAQIALASATEIRFGSIGFRYNSGNRRLEMSNDGGTSWPPLVTDVSGLTFSYFNQTAAQLTSFPLPQADREDVRRIVVDLQLARGGESAHLRTSVYLRSFMNEVSTSVGP